MKTSITNLVPLPKVLLHEHLDGGLRPQTLFDLCAERGIALPVRNAAELAELMLNNSNCGNLAQYVSNFNMTVRAMASAAACERVAFEAAEDARLEGCVLAEFRMAPTLLERYGLQAEVAIEAMLRGLKRSALPCGLIICAMRTDDTATTLRSAQLAARYKNQGVIGFDLAGAELGFPPGLHARAIEYARTVGLGVTIHAGEADDGVRVLEAAQLGAIRIGHGVRVMMGAGAMHTLEALRSFNLHFEVCPTSNIHTGIVQSMAQHPIRAMWDAGLELSCHTDNRLMSGVTQTQELQSLHRELKFSLAEILQMQKLAAQASFMSSAQKEAALAKIEVYSVPEST